MNFTEKRIKEIRKQSIDVTKLLSYKEKQARDIAFNKSFAYSVIEGWMWNICWDEAREYYRTKEFDLGNANEPSEDSEFA